jgi:Tfp pilus assembly protein PilF
MVLRISFLLLFLLPLHSHAQPADSPMPPHAASVDIDARIEKLRSAYSLFPLNGTFKRDLAEAYATYGFMFFKKRQFEQADEYFVKALDIYPEDTNYTLMRGICTYYLKKYDVAHYELKRLLELKPDSVDGLYFLGQTLYDSEQRQQAVEQWQQALKLSPERSDITALLEKARREMAVENDMDRGHSSRFNVTYDPGVSATTAQSIMDVLESAANQIGAELGHFPEARVPVAIYKRDDYKTVTASPDWSGGYYDGTIRLPFGTVTEITPPLRAILFHEYAHVVVFDLTRGNCPVWLNEGIAEIFGRKQLNRDMETAHGTATKGGIVDFRKLEASFSALSSQQASAAYQQSYDLVNYLVEVHGWHRVKEILGYLGKGMNISSAIATTLGDYGITYDGLIAEWQASQAQKR